MPEVLAAAETLTHAAEREIAWMFLARIDVLRAIHRNLERSHSQSKSVRGAKPLRNIRPRSEEHS
jgi:hypothetical protein